MRTLAIRAGTKKHKRDTTPSALQPNRSQTLDKGAVRSLANWRPTRITVERGRLWLTITGDSEDHFLCAGQSLTITRRGRIVVQAMDDSRFEVGIAT